MWPSTCCLQECSDKISTDEVTEIVQSQSSIDAPNDHGDTRWRCLKIIAARCVVLAVDFAQAGLGAIDKYLDMAVVEIEIRKFLTIENLTPVV